MGRSASPPLYARCPLLVRHKTDVGTRDHRCNMVGEEDVASSSKCLEAVRITKPESTEAMALAASDPKC